MLFIEDAALTHSRCGATGGQGLLPHEPPDHTFYCFIESDEFSHLDCLLSAEETSVKEIPNV